MASAVFAALAGLGKDYIEHSEGHPVIDELWWNMKEGDQSQSHQEQSGREATLNMYFEHRLHCVSIKARRTSSDLAHMEGLLALMIPGRHDPAWANNWRDDGKHEQGLDHTFCGTDYDFSQGMVMVTSMHCGSAVHECGSTTEISVHLTVLHDDVVSEVHNGTVIV